MNQNPPAVVVRRLRKNYGRIEALKGVDLSIAQGEFLTLLGPNGAGKTTLVKILSTLMTPTDGSAEVCGLPLAGNGMAVRRKIGVVSHQNFLYPELTARENLRFHGRMFDAERLEARIDAMGEKMRLRFRMDDPVGSYSHGMKQRLTIARALLHDPEILLFDEPYAGLDPQAAALLNEVLREIHREGKAVLVTTHNFEQALPFSDRIAIMRAGSVAFEDRTRNVDLSGFLDLYLKCVRGGEAAPS